LVYRTKPIFEVAGASDATAADAQTEGNSKPVSDALIRDDLGILPPSVWNNLDARPNR